MITSTTSIARPRSYRVFIRLALIGITVIVLAVAGVAAWFLATARLALPQIDGTMALAGLHSPASVARDAQGVPHITAATLEDLFFTQGYVTAQDRLWQMDMLRRYAAGELAEVLGSSQVEHDRQQRTLLMREVAANAAARLSPRDRAFFEAYAQGVNAYLASQKHLPVEFHLLGYQPRPWTVTDSFLVASTMLQRLTLTKLPNQLSREKISAHLSPELAADLYPNSSWRDHPPVSAPGQDEILPAGQEGEEDEEQRESAAPAKPAPAPRRRRVRRHVHPARRVLKTGAPGRCEWPGANCETQQSFSTPDPQLATELYPGSNNWVVSGAHTVSGKPLLSNDMHLGHQIPNVWYETQLTSGSFDVAGVSLPGVPMVVVGHNQRIAWGFTNLGAAVADFFVESFNQRGEYLTPDGWRQPEHRHEVIHVRGHRTQSLEVTVTRHGPIVSALYRGESRMLALKWIGYDPGAVEVPLFDMDSAQNWEQFREALRHFGSPAQNVVYADIDGHIGYQATGKIPMRTAGDGSTPVSGADNGHEWTGYIPFEQLPSVFDPPSGVLATANGRITPDGFPLAVSNEWGSSYRTERIVHVLGSDRKLAPADMLALQTDVESDFDRFCAQRLVYSIDHSPQASARVRQAAELMRDWDGRISTDSAAATIVARSRQQLQRLLLEPKIGEMWRDYQWSMAPVWLENMLLLQPAQWLPAGYASWDELSAAAVNAAVSQPDAPRDLKDWRWGKDNFVDVEHPLFAGLPLFRRWTGTGRQAQSGSGVTVKQVGTHFGPSERMTVDFANLDGSTLNLVNGQSGQIFSPHYMDQWRAWYEGTTFVLPFSAAAVDRARTHLLTLEPK